MSADPAKRAQRVLFLCTGNSARSIIAEALLRARGGAAFQVYSAGTEPKGINPYTVRVLREIGIEIAGARSTHVDELAGEHFDYVITVCDDAAERCPVFAGETVRLHWSTPDPASAVGGDDEVLEALRRARRTLEQQVERFVSSLAAQRPAPNA